MARNQPFVPVLLFISGCGTITADNDQAAEQKAKPALASQKHAFVFNSAIPSDFVNLPRSKTSISSAEPKRKLEEGS